MLCITANLTADDRDGSLASKAAEAVRPCTSATPPKAEVNSTPWPSPLCATTGLVHRSKPRTDLLNDLISPRKQRGRHIEPEGLRGFQVNHQLVFGRRLDREVGGLLALEDAIDVAGRPPVRA